MKTILLIHGPNLNFLGRRDQNHYGVLTLKEIEKLIEKESMTLGYNVISFQSNHEGALIDFLQEKNIINTAGIIINPGALAHYSYALHDALSDIHLPAVEVHLSDINNREKWRKNSVIAPACIAVVSGEKENGYIKALKILDNQIKYGSQF